MKVQHHALRNDSWFGCFFIPCAADDAGGDFRVVIHDPPVRRGSCRGRGDGDEAAPVKNSGSERLGGAVLDSGAVDPPEGEEPGADGLVVCPCGILTEGFGDEVDKDCEDSDWEDCKSEDCIEELVGLPGEARGSRHGGYLV